MSKQAARIAKEKEISKSRGVIYVGHIPHGFYEDELRKYFSQFGEVTRVRVSRSRKTGKKIATLNTALCSIALSN